MSGATPEPAVKALFYQAKPVPLELQGLIAACQTGPLDRVKALWDDAWLTRFKLLRSSDTCHPLLTAAHHLKVDIVEYLCEKGLSPYRTGTVHPYTGDGMVVSELQGISPMGLVDKMLFHHPRKSKKKFLLLAVKEVLMKAAQVQQQQAAKAKATPDRSPAVTGVASTRERRDAPTVDGAAATPAARLPTGAPQDSEVAPVAPPPAKKKSKSGGRKRRLDLGARQAPAPAPAPTPARRRPEPAAPTATPQPRPQQQPPPAQRRRVEPPPAAAAPPSTPATPARPAAAPPAAAPAAPAASPPRAAPATPTLVPTTPARAPAAAAPSFPAAPPPPKPLPFPSLAVELGEATPDAQQFFSVDAPVPSTVCTTVWPVVPAGVPAPQVLLRAVQALVTCQRSGDLGELASTLQTSLDAVNPRGRVPPSSATSPSPDDGLPGPPPAVPRLHNTWSSVLPRVTRTLQPCASWLAHVHVPRGSAAGDSTLPCVPVEAHLRNLVSEDGLRAVIVSVDDGPPRGAASPGLAASAGRVLLYLVNQAVITRWVYRGSRCILAANDPVLPAPPHVPIDGDVAAALYVNFLLRCTSEDEARWQPGPAAPSPTATAAAGAGAGDRTPPPTATPVTTPEAGRGARPAPSSGGEGTRQVMASSSRAPPSDDSWCAALSPTPVMGWFAPVTGATVVIGLPPSCHSLWPLNTGDIVVDSLADVTNAAVLQRLRLGWAITTTPVARVVLWVHSQVATTVAALGRILAEHLKAVVGSIVVSTDVGLDVVLVCQDPPCFGPGAITTADVDTIGRAFASCHYVSLSAEVYTGGLIPLPATGNITPSSPTPVRPVLVRTTSDPRRRCLLGCVRLRHNPDMVINKTATIPVFQP